MPGDQVLVPGEQVPALELGVWRLLRRLGEGYRRGFTIEGMHAVGILDGVLPHLDVQPEFVNRLARLLPLGSVSHPLLRDNPAQTETAFDCGCEQLSGSGISWSGDLRLLEALMRAAVTVSRQGRLHVSATSTFVRHVYADRLEPSVSVRLPDTGLSRELLAHPVNILRWSVRDDRGTQRALAGELSRVLGNEADVWEVFAVLVNDAEAAGDDVTLGQIAATARRL